MQRRMLSLQGGNVRRRFSFGGILLPELPHLRKRTQI